VWYLSDELFQEKQLSHFFAKNETTKKRGKKQEKNQTTLEHVDIIFLEPAQNTTQHKILIAAKCVVGRRKLAEISIIISAQTFFRQSNSRN
jgi:hypothetical protein